MSIAVVGGGISGLAAAIELCELGARDITIYEQSSRLGGKIQTEMMWGHAVERGPDSFLTRVPHGLDLARLVGIEPLLVGPQATKALLYRRRSLHQFPEGLVLGAPTQPDQILRNSALTPSEKLRAISALLLPIPGRSGSASDDLGRLVSQRFSAPYAKTMIEPLVGGINAGTIFGASAATIAPQILALIRSRHAVIPQTSPGSSKSLFASPRGGLGVLIDACETYLRDRGVDVRTSTSISKVAKAKHGWKVTSPTTNEFHEGLVLALPAFSVGALLESTHEALAEKLYGIRYSSVAMAIVQANHTPLPVSRDYSGVLVAREGDYLTTAVTIASQKWPQWSDTDHLLLRISTGRTGDRRHLDLGDETLAAILVGEAEEILGVRLSVTNTAVTRWNDGFPQFAPHHGDYVRQLFHHANSLPPLALASAYIGGSGIPTCIRVAQQGARHLWSQLN